MTIILFLIDTSASMCQKVHVNGVQKTYLDVAKGAVETFLKFRQRSQDCMGDRYMLLTFEEPPGNVKAGWKENHATFMHELKNLQSNGLTCMGEALKNGFDLLNLNRMQSGIDTYGQGRCPFYLETSVIIVITDGGKYSFRSGVHNEIVLPLHAQIPGTKLTKEPFRWDQRLFSLVLRMAGHRVDERIDVKVPHDDSPIEKMCEVTGGRSYRVRSHYVLNHCIESLVQKVQAGVVVQFEPALALTKQQPESNNKLETGDHALELAFPPTKKMIYVQKNMSNKSYPIGYWPLPEPYWPDPKAVQLPPRDAHPRIRLLSPCVEEPVPVRNFPVDKYELEPSALTMQILARRDVNRCWPAVVVNSGPGGAAAVVAGGVTIPTAATTTGHELPFGYLKANNTFTQVYLVVLPINYPVLLPLLHDLLHRYMGNPPNEWMYKFTNYVRSIPQYYCPFLRRALASISVPYQLLTYIIPENLDSYLSQPVANHLKSLKNAAKQDLEALCMRIFKQLKHPRPPHKPVETAKLIVQGVTAATVVGLTGGIAAGTNGQQQQPPQPIGGIRKEMVSHPMLRDTFAKVHSECQFHDNYTIVVPVATVRGQLTGSAPVTHATAGNVGGLASSGGVSGGASGVLINGGGGPPAALRASRNPFDIRRRDLVDEIARMRENFFKMVGPSGGLTMGGVSGGHSLPISEMGNYQEYLKNKETPLREIEPTNVRQHMFGNPYKKDKHMVMVDEADMVGDVAPMMKTGGGGGGGGGTPPPPMMMMMMNKKLAEGGGAGGGVPKMASRKRKAGPIARDYKFRRLSSTTSSQSGSGSESGSEAGSSVAASEDFDDEEQPLVMDFEERDVVEEQEGEQGEREQEEKKTTMVGEGAGGGGAVEEKKNVNVIKLEPLVGGGGRVNGSGVGAGRGLVSMGSIKVKGELLSGEAGGGSSGSSSGAVTISYPSAVPVVLTPSEGVLSPVYQQQLPVAAAATTTTTVSSPLSPVGVIVPAGGGGVISVVTSQQQQQLAPPTVSQQNMSPNSVSSSSSNVLLAPTAAAAATGVVVAAAGGVVSGATTASSSNSSDVRKHLLPNGTTTGGGLSNYNDADAISKILQQSCSQHNGGGGSSGGEGERKKGSSSSSSRTGGGGEPLGEEEATISTSSVAASTVGGAGGAAAGGGRKRRQMMKMSSAELLEVSDSWDAEKDGDSVSVGRRQSPRMGGGSNNKATKEEPEEKEGGHHRSWSSRRKGTASREKNHKTSSSAAAVKATEEEDEEEDEENSRERRENDEAEEERKEGLSLDAWSTAGDSVDVIRESNFETRTTLFHDIRRPGRDYGQLLKHLELVRGDFETQFAFVQMCIAEAMRFHRKKMATTIQEWWDQKIDRVTRAEGSNGRSGSRSGGRGGQRERTTTTVVKVAVVTPPAAAPKVVEATGGGTKGSRQKSNVKLRSTTVPASKC